VVGVVGEAGVGKSRLCETFAERARARGVRVYEAHCPSHARALAGVAARELVRSFCAVEERDSPEEARRKIAGTLVLLDPSFRDSLPLVFELAGVADVLHPLPPVDPASRRRM
jgi:adenylate cyclase